VEDPTRTSATRKQIDLIRDPCASGIDEPKDRQLVAQRDLSHPNDLLYSPSPPGASLDAGVIGHDKGRPPLNQTASGDNPVSRQIVGHRISKLAVFDEGAVVEQQVDPITDVELVRACQLGRRAFGGRRSSIAGSFDRIHDQLLHR
jgi:hypothetical protein